MADEFIAQTHPVEISALDSIASVLVDDGLCVIEREQANEVLLRWNGTPRRVEWPEDVALRLLEDGVLLTAHTGTKSQIERIIHLAEMALSNELGVPVSFDDA
ncbi:hypothetical protein [Luteolibacter sp. LG18]|uniref:hypothetical protein n=1 Tax=Luteolibacter sp. LG18 TaxID=2819286 RepID=UPI002B2C3848|nr:hypothetical protein llg_35780 [Luteolibacter sp. LG18]